MSNSCINTDVPFDLYPYPAHARESLQAPPTTPGRGLSGTIGRIAAGALIATLPAQGLAGAAQGYLYPNTSPTLESVTLVKSEEGQANPSEDTNLGDLASSIDIGHFDGEVYTLKHSNVKYIFIPGFGSKKDDAAPEFLHAIDRDVDAMRVTLANQGILIDSLAKEILKNISEEGNDKFSLVGTSMGFNIGMVALAYILETNPDITIPPLDIIVANSSPASIEDALDSKSASIANIIAKDEYIHPLLKKMIFALFDGKGDPLKTLNIANRIELFKHIHDSVLQTVNHSSPELEEDKIELLFNFDLKRIVDILRVRGVITDETKIIYLMAEDDETVDSEAALKKFEEVFGDIIVLFVKSNHANTAAGTKVLAGFLEYEAYLESENSEYQAQLPKPSK